jgi:hypothetical protein
MTLSTKGLLVTLSIMTRSMNKTQLSTLCHCTECRVLCIVMLYVVSVSVIMLTVVMLNVIMLSVVAPAYYNESGKKSFTEFVYRSVTLYRHQNDLK